MGKWFSQPVEFKITRKRREPTRETFERYRRAALFLYRRRHPHARVFGSSATCSDLHSIFAGDTLVVLVDSTYR